MFLNGLIGIMTAASLISGIMLGRMDQVCTAVLQTGSQVLQTCGVLLGNLCLWGGLMKIAQQSGVVSWAARKMTKPVLLLFPDISPGEPVFGVLCMSIIANVLGLGAAATPLGLRAMHLLHQKHGGSAASNDMVTLMVLNTASIQLLPNTAAVLRQQAASAAPMEILVPVWIATGCSVLTGLVLCKFLGR